MNHGSQETRSFFNDLKNLFQENRDSGREIQEATSHGALTAAIFPSAPYFELTRSEVQKTGLPIQVGSQNTHFEKKGAFTGEFSAPMLGDFGIELSLVGHSERRQFFSEADSVVQIKVQSLLSQKMQVVCCIGETETERKEGHTHSVLRRQIEAVLCPPRELPKNLEAVRVADFLGDRLLFAYEPVWAIGTGITAKPEQAQEAHSFIRSELARLASVDRAQKTPLLYGGSVTPENLASLLQCKDVDGGLVGGASLKASSFYSLLCQGAAAAKARLGNYGGAPR